MKPQKILCVVGARPNFMKIAPVMHALRDRAGHLEPVLVHTGQHYDDAMNGRFFRELDIPTPDVNLDVGSGSHARQTAEIMKRFDGYLDTSEADNPALVVVVGDVNSTVACALVAAKRGIPVAHVEAGLRSFDRSMPEEINRMLTDRISDLLFVSEPSGMTNLAAEGVAPERCHLVGNVMIDTLFNCRKRAVPAAQTLESIVEGPAPERYGVVTLHRPSNVDSDVALTGILDSLANLSRDLPLVFPMHPRVRQRVERLYPRAVGAGQAQLYHCEPLGYLPMLGLLQDAALVLTDSGGIQEETTALGVPCLTLRENTERPITVEQGTNELVGRDTNLMLRRARDILADGLERRPPPPLWDGAAATRIVDIVAAYVNGNG